MFEGKSQPDGGNGGDCQVDEKNDSMKNRKDKGKKGRQRNGNKKVFRKYNKQEPNADCSSLFNFSWFFWLNSWTFRIRIDSTFSMCSMRRVTTPIIN